MESFNVAEAKTRLSEILDKVLEGEEVILTRRGTPIARVVPMERTESILGSGCNDSNINRQVLDKDTWWKALPDSKVREWYE